MWVTSSRGAFTRGWSGGSQPPARLGSALVRRAVRLVRRMRIKAADGRKKSVEHGTDEPGRYENIGQQPIRLLRARNRSYHRIPLVTLRNQLAT